MSCVYCRRRALTRSDHSKGCPERAETPRTKEHRQQDWLQGWHDSSIGIGERLIMPAYLLGYKAHQNNPDQSVVARLGIPQPNVFLQVNL